MNRFPRFNQYKALVYRIGLAYLFYMVARILFFIYNEHLVKIDSPTDFIKLAYHGLAFDTTAIIYANILFIVLSIFPLVINTKKAIKNFFFIFISSSIYSLTQRISLILFITNTPSIEVRARFVRYVRK